MIAFIDSRLLFSELTATTSEALIRTKFLRRPDSGAAAAGTPPVAPFEPLAEASPDDIEAPVDPPAAGSAVAFAPGEDVELGWTW
jgi:hypothetical protein